jgi:hypothetical protein
MAKQTLERQQKIFWNALTSREDLKYRPSLLAR